VVLHHDSGQQVLTCVLLHVIPSALPVYFLADLVAGGQRLGGVDDAAETLALDVFDGDGSLVAG
jgi:hypothetical protein